MERVLKAIYGQVRSGKDYRSYVDLKDFCREVMKTDIPLAIKYLSLLSDRIEQVMPTLPFEEMGSFFELHHDVVLLGAPHSFHLYLLVVEWKRDPDRKFYPPRRRVLKVLVDDLQDLADGKLDFLGISLPPRVGKSTLCIFFMTWMMGRNPDVANVMSGHSDTAYYRDMREIIDDATWNAKYQGAPYIREGLLFPEDELLTYNGVLPDGDPEKVVVCDVAWGGGDSVDDTPS